ncbi:kanamycin kinase [Anaerococcus porci]|uniref:kanamycin kinase n=1 Tax=Anaerococcus porci TaxID=2652269 RepID=UPI002A762ADE|nr:kanamycin kinase [Anaerococcus porci]MDY3007226.1 kanamycin kinase [Anaerococcus porci]
MDKNAFDIIKRTNIFKNDINNIKKLSKISSNKLKFDFNGITYVVGLYPIEDFDNLKKENEINNYLRSIDVNPLDLYEIGIMPDLDKSYKVFEFRNEISLKEYISKYSSKEVYNIGLKFGEILKKIHMKKIDSNLDYDWHKKIETKINLLLYRQGLNKNNGVNDYILIDYLQNNSYICKNTSSNILYEGLNDKNIRIYDNDKIDIRGLKDLKVGDGISDFVNINKISITSPDFAKGVLKSYHEGEQVSRKFFRLLSLYQAYYLLESLVNIRENKESYLNEEEIEKIILMYDNFSTIIPSWV